MRKKRGGCTKEKTLPVTIDPITVIEQNENDDNNDNINDNGGSNGNGDNKVCKKPHKQEYCNKHGVESYCKKTIGHEKHGENEHICKSCGKEFLD